MTTQSGNSQLLTTALKVVEGYNNWDIDAILEPRASNCTHLELPARLDRPELDNEAYREQFSRFSHLFTQYRVDILDTIEDAARHKVVLHLQSRGETAIGEYSNEYVLILQMTEDDTQVIHIKELVDFAYAQEYFGKLKDHLVAASKEKTK